MMGEIRRIKVNKPVTKNKLLDYGFRYKENGDYRLDYMFLYINGTIKQPYMHIFI